MKYSILFLPVLFILFGCNKSTSTLSIPVIGHAITGLYNPQRIYKDNTLEAFHYALLFPALKGIEIDVQLSKDGTLWLYHDEDLSSQTNSKGKIADLSDQFLSQVSYSSFHKENLAKLKDIVIPQESMHIHLFIDLKDFNYRKMDGMQVTQLKQALQEFMSNQPNVDHLSIILPDLSYLADFPQSEFSSIFTDISSKDDGLNKKELYPLLEGVFIRNGNLTQNDVELLQKNQLEVIIFDMRSMASIRKAKQKKPNWIMVEEFKIALKEQ